MLKSTTLETSDFLRDTLSDPSAWTDEGEATYSIIVEVKLTLHL